MCRGTTRLESSALPHCAHCMFVAYDLRVMPRAIQCTTCRVAASMIPHLKWDEMLLTACSMACVMHRAARHLPGNHSATWHAGLVHSIAVLSEGHRWAHIPCRVGYCQVCAGSQAHALLEGRLPSRAGSHAEYPEESSPVSTGERTRGAGRVLTLRVLRTVR
jgi:hypothetical protein